MENQGNHYHIIVHTYELGKEVIIGSMPVMTCDDREYAIAFAQKHMEYWVMVQGLRYPNMRGRTYTTSYLNEGDEVPGEVQAMFEYSNPKNGIRETIEVMFCDGTNEVMLFTPESLSNIMNQLGIGKDHPFSPN